MKNSRKVKGFTLVELIVVIAIIGILAGLLVPSVLGYVQKARRRVDASNARQIYNDVLQVLYTDDTLYDGYKNNTTPEKQTALQSWSITSGSVFVRSVPESGSFLDTGDKTYKITVACYMDSTLQNVGAAADKLTWEHGTAEKVAFAAALRNFQGQKKLQDKKKGAINLLSKSYKGASTVRWLICYRNSEDGKSWKTDQIEIWVGDKGSEPKYRLYPNPCEGYA